MITRTFLADLAERAAATYLEGLIGFLIVADSLDLSAVGVAALAALPAVLSMIKNTLLELTGNGGPAPTFWVDVAERTGVAYVVSFLGILLASPALTIGTAKAAVVAALPAGLAVLKGVAARFIGRTDSAAVLPERLDPAT